MTGPGSSTNPTHSVDASQEHPNSPRGREKHDSRLAIRDSRPSPDHFDAVVVGSGFGGAVMAYRLAEAGLSVCVLERGKAYPPGSFPRSPYRMRTNFWHPGADLYGLFNIWSFRHLYALVASGLGGGSLIYANVLLRKDEKWFVKEDLENGGYEHWPVTRADLEEHYDRVERMLGAQPYPFDQAPYDSTSKTRAFKAAAENLGMDFFLPNLAVAFAPSEGEVPVPGAPIREEHPNLHGKTRSTCRLCGECDIGCNYGAKNTLDYNYLSEAKRLGADIRTLSEAKEIEPHPGGGYAVRYVRHEEEGQEEPTRTTSLSADRLILAAGTLGTTFLLLRNRASFPALSDRLGARFCGNGDLLTFAIKPSESSSVGGKKTPRVIDPGYGPVITSAVRVPDELDGAGEGRGFYLQDAGFPEFVTWMLLLFDTPGALWRWPLLLASLLKSRIHPDPDPDISARLSKLLSRTHLSAGLLPMLAMGRDVPDGIMRLSPDARHLDIDWRKDKSGPYFDRVREASRAIAGELGARFRANPAWYLGRAITVHPLGGCPMGRSKYEGVVDPYGEVFGHPNLYVADGSVMPGPVGANPSLTIAALADRFADRIIDEKGAHKCKPTAAKSGP